MCVSLAELAVPHLAHVGWVRTRGATVVPRPRETTAGNRGGVDQERAAVKPGRETTTHLLGRSGPELGENGSRQAAPTDQPRYGVHTLLVLIPECDPVRAGSPVYPPPTLARACWSLIDKDPTRKSPSVGVGGSVQSQGQGAGANAWAGPSQARQRACLQIPQHGYIAVW